MLAGAGWSELLGAGGALVGAKGAKVVLGANIVGADGAHPEQPIPPQPEQDGPATVPTGAAG